MLAAEKKETIKTLDSKLTLHCLDSKLVLILTLEGTQEINTVVDLLEVEDLRLSFMIMEPREEKLCYNKETDSLKKVEECLVKLTQDSKNKIYHQEFKK
jgi:hypothetical protein